MGHDKTNRGRAARGTLGICALALFLFAFAPSALAAPTHPHIEALDIAGLNHACGTAVDSEGDVYASSAGESKVKVFDPSHTELTSIANANEPCGLAVNGKGELFVSEKATGKVVKYTPNTYPFSGTPTYGAATTIDASGTAKGIAVDPVDDRLYVAEGNRIDSYNPDGSLGINEAQRVSINQSSGGTFRLALPAEGGPGRNEVQSISRAFGSYTLTFDGQTTASLAANASAAEVDAALEALSTIGLGNVSVVGFSNRSKWIEFTGALAETDVPLITSAQVTAAALSDITSPIAYEASAETVKAALEALQGIGTGNVSVEPQGSEYRFTFVGGLAHTDVPGLVGDPSGLTPDGSGFNPEANAGTTTQGWSGHIGEGDLAEATGVAAYTYKINEEETTRYLFAADAATDQVKFFSGSDFRALKLHRTIKGPKAGEDFGFGAPGAYLAADPGNRSTNDKCSSIDEQACTAGHLFVYDSAHEAVDEFDSTGEFLDQISSAAFADANPTALAVERSGGPNDGTIYVTAGPGAGAKALAFGPLVTPTRPALPGLSHVLTGARAVATDSYGDVYVAAESTIHVYDPAGNEIKVGPEEKGIPDTRLPYDLAADSTGKVYVLDGPTFGQQLTYYTPTHYPPLQGTEYTRHEPVLLQSQPGINRIAVNPADDHVFVGMGNGEDPATNFRILEFGSAKEGSPGPTVFAPFFGFFNGAQGLDAYGANGNVYAVGNQPSIIVLDSNGAEIDTEFSGAGCPNAKHGTNPAIAVDQSNGHALEFKPGQAGASAREYDASGACVVEFGTFSGTGFGYDIAVDSACAIHRNGGGESKPLTEATTPTCAEFDPANGSAYVAYDSTNNAAQPYDLTAFGPLFYGEAPLATTLPANGVGVGKATLNGSVNPHGFDLTDCHFEYVTEAAFEHTGFSDLSSGGSKLCVPGLVEIGKGSEPVAVHADIGSLDPDGRYRFRLVAKNKYGQSDGEPGLFGPPLPTAETALPVLYTEATLRAEVDPSGLPTKYRFEYGLGEGEYGHSTPVTELAPSVGKVEVQAPLTELEEGKTYHFRIVAENEAKTVVVEGLEKEIFTTLERAEPQECLNTEYRTGHSANLPDCRAYELVTPADTRGLEPGALPPGSAGSIFNNWLVDPRGEGAGESLAYFAGTLPSFEGSGDSDGYRAERGPGAHPSAGWTNELIGPTYAQLGGGSGNNQEGVASDQLYSLWTVSPVESFEGTLAKGHYLRTPSGFELVGQGSLGTDPEAISRFISAGGRHVIFFSKAHLQDEAAPNGTLAIYDREAGATSAEVLSVPPTGASVETEEEFETKDAEYRGASEDGSAIVFKVGDVLYLHREGETVEVAEAPNTFAGISEDGQRVFYMDATFAEDPPPSNLYACDTETGSCAGPDATHPPTEISKESIFVNVSPDGSNVFFTSEEALTGSEENEAGETAQPSAHNLYAWDSSTTRFIAILDQQDFESFGGQGEEDMFHWTAAINPGQNGGRAKSPTRSTPDGEVFVFQSHARLTSYDNEGQSEIYRYTPAAAPGERLLCVSCDPSGSPASADAMLQVFAGSAKGSTETTTLITNVTDDGQEVFFNSPDRLLPEDANSAVDVYEWKAKGDEACKRPDGCLALISSGQGEEPSTLYGMSADGRDVFFQTPEKLVGQDVPGSSSIYDARVEGGIPDPPAAAPCRGDACQGQGSTPPALPTPASSGLGGGNAEPQPLPCAKSKHRVKGRCVSKHHKRRHHHRRAHANGRAHR